MPAKRQIAGRGPASALAEIVPRQQAEPAAATPAAISGRVSASGRRQAAQVDQRQRQQPPAEQGREPGRGRPTARPSASAPMAAAPSLDQRVEGRQRRAAMPAAAAGRAASSTTGRGRARSGACRRRGSCERPEQHAAPAVRLAQHERADEAADAQRRAARPDERRVRPAPGRGSAAPGRRRQAVGVRRGPLAGHDQRLRIGHGRPLPGRRDIGLAAHRAAGRRLTAASAAASAAPR